jgi:hypothetical protein
VFEAFRSNLSKIPKANAVCSKGLPHSSRPNEADPRPEETRKEIMRWLSVVQYRKHHQRVSKILLRETGQWLFAKPEFKEWYNAKGSAILWLHGIRKFHLPLPN